MSCSACFGCNRTSATPVVPAACSPVIASPGETGCSGTADNRRQQEAGCRETARNRNEKCDWSDLQTLSNTKRQFINVLDIGSKQEMEEVALLQQARACGSTGPHVAIYNNQMAFDNTI